MKQNLTDLSTRTVIRTLLCLLLLSLAVPMAANAQNSASSAMLCRGQTCHLLSTPVGPDTDGSIRSFLPVLLVHGLVLDRSQRCRHGSDEPNYWGAMPTLLGADRGGQQGLDVWLLRYDSASAIEASAPAVGQAVRRIKEVTGAPAVVVVAHSLGGLLAREYLQSSQDAGNDVARLITIGTPHLGFASIDLPGLDLSPCASINDMLRASGYIDTLNTRTRDTPANLWAPNSDYVFLAGKRLFAVPRVGRSVKCVPEPSDGLVMVNSALARSVYHDAIRESYVAYPHNEFFFSLLPQCRNRERAQAAPDDQDYSHDMYAATRRWASIADPRASGITFLFGDGPYIRRMNEGGQVVESFYVGSNPSVFDAKGRTIAFADASGVATYDTITQELRALANASWVQTLRWTPGPTNRIVHGDVDGRLYFVDANGSSGLWQDNDTAAVFGRNTYRGGLDWSDDGKVIARIGVGGAGGDGVFIGTACSSDATHNICGLAPLSNPAGSSSSWETIAYAPVLSKNGRYAYYGERINSDLHRIVRHDLAIDARTTLFEQHTSGEDTGFGYISLYDGDRSLIVPGLSRAGDRNIVTCRNVDTPSGSVCTTIDPPGTFDASQLLPVRW